MTLSFIDRLTRHSARVSGPLAGADGPGRCATLEELHREIESAIAVGESDFALRLCNFVADQFPTDLWTHRLLGCASLETGDWNRSSLELDLTLTLDPEDAAGLTMLGVAHCSAGRTREAIWAFARAIALDPGENAARASLAELTSKVDSQTADLAPPLALCRQLVDTATEAAATAEIESGLKRFPRDLGLLVLRAELLWKFGRLSQAERVCRQVLTRYPRALVPRYILGHIMLTESAREGAGADLIHATQSDDLAGVVARRIFDGTGFEPPVPASHLNVELPGGLATPRSVAAVVDLDEDEPEPAAFPDDSNVEVDLFLEAVGSEDLAAADGDAAEVVSALPDEQREIPSVLEATRPRLIGVAVRESVIRRYGLEGFERLDRRLKAVSRELALLGMSFDPIFVDDTASMASVQCAAASNLTASGIRIAINDLWRKTFDATDSPAAPRDRAVILIGGDDIVPFFRLPNPADDDDGEILTDAPYGTLDATSPLLPDVAVGRLPDGYAGNLSLLLRQLDNLVEARREPLIHTYPKGILGAGRLALNAIGLGRSRTSALACVAADRTAIAGLVVSAVTPGGLVQACPPDDPASFDLRWLSDHRCLFFDVSGTPDGESWFGQAAQSEETQQWEAPLAFGVDNLAEAHLRSPVVFTTAGYATHFASEEASGSLALRFLSEGAAAFVGSSASVYGASSVPLAGADLLANLFWGHLHEGYPVGKALGLARETFASIELDRQGFLDGDDQKTLLEFGVYGDPLFRVFDRRGNEDDPPDPLIVGSDDFLCKTGSAGIEPPNLDRRLVREVAEFVTSQHAELASASVRIQRRIVCDGSCKAEIHRGAADDQPTDSHGVTFVTARTDVATAGARATLSRIARASLDDEGQIVKLVISR